MKVFQSTKTSQTGATATYTSSTQLQGHRLLLLRVLWIIMVLFAFIIYLLNLPAYYYQLQTTCSALDCFPGQLSSQQMALLERFGLSIQLYALSLVTFNLFAMCIWTCVGSILFARKVQEPITLLVSLTLMIGGLVPPGPAFPGYAWINQLVIFLAIVLLYLIFCLFPRGSFQPPWIRWLAILFTLLNVLDFFPKGLFHLPMWLLATYFVLTFLCINILLGNLFYRYRYVSTIIERQQIKWVILSCLIISTGLFIFWLCTLWLPWLKQLYSLYDLFLSPIIILLTLLIPLSLGFAILRYHLWDVDLLINRTLVYASLTGILALLYAGCILVLSTLVHRLTGQNGDSPLVVAGSTLAIAAIFQPLRRAIQSIIDHRFYRSKYDAAQTLTAFSLTLHHEFDLQTLNQRLIDVVDQTMQPTHVSLWLRSREQNTEDEQQN